MTDSPPLDAASAPEVAGEKVGIDDAPAVVAVVVALESVPTDVEATLVSLAEQDYANLSVLVIDAGAQSIADHVVSRLPDANVHRLGGTPGFAAAANQALGLVAGGSFFLFCSDFVALDSSCISRLVEELYRSNAGIVTPKFVQWDDPRRLAAIGMGSDRFGVQIDLVEPGDFDQEQYDGVRDVFVAPTGVQLVRADLFRALGGFDPVMESAGQDLDLCWRAQVAGARVVAVPSAVARIRPEHIGSAATVAASRAAGTTGRDVSASATSGDAEEAGPEEAGPEEAGPKPADPERATDRWRQLTSRHRLRTLLVTSSRFSLLRVLPLAVVLLLVEAVYSLAAGRRRQAVAALGSIGWNFSHLSEIRSRRASLGELRQVGDRDVHGLQAGGSARLNQYFRGQLAVGDRLVSLAGSVRNSFTGQDSSAVRDASIVGALVGALLLFGSRGLITDGVAPVGQFLELPGTSTLLGEWVGDWRSAGVGGVGHPPLAYAVLGVLKALFFWADGLLDLLLVLVPIGCGVMGAWRLSRPLASARSSALATLAYAGNPLLVAIIGAGRWDSLVVWAVAPALFGSLLRVQGVAPYGLSGGSPGPTVVDRELPIRLLRFGLLVAAVGTFAPAIIVVAVILAGALALGSVLAGRLAGLKNLVFASAVALIVPAAIHGPWSIDFLRSFDWNWLVGPPSPHAGFDSLADLIRFAPDGDPGRFLPFGLLLAAGLALLIANGNRYEGAVRAWTVAVVFFAVAWVDRRGWLPMALPAAEMLLVPSAVGLSLAVGAGARAIDIDLVGYRFGWRHVASFVGVVALAASALSLLSHASNGRWDQPTQGFGRSTALLAEQYEGVARVLWIGSPAVLPIDAQTSEAGTSFAVTDGGSPTVLGRWAPMAYGFESDIGASLDLASASDTARLGRLLVPFGIDLIIVADRLALAPYDGPQHDPGGGIVEALSSQLDLQRVSGTPGLLVYRNIEARGPVVALPDDLDLPSVGDPMTRLGTDISAGARVRTTDVRPDIALPVRAEELGGDRTLVAVVAEGWETEDGSVSEAYGGLLVVDGVRDGTIVSRQTRWLWRLALVGQLALIACGGLLAQSRREDEA